MGCGSSSNRSISTFECVRVVHINGYVEDFTGPVTVGEITGNPPRLVCFSPAQLLSFSARPLGLDVQLEPGRLYFLLPQSVLQSDSSPADLAALATRLTALARNGGGAAVPPSPLTAKLPIPYANEFDSAESQRADAGPAWKLELGNRYAYGVAGGVVQSWKPILDTIEESFRRSTIDERSFKRSSTTGGSSRSGTIYTRLVAEEEKLSS